MATQSGLVLVTGASGLLGAHVVDRALKDGYNVRAVARSAKVSILEERYAEYGDRVQVARVDDLAQGDFTAALVGVKALIHIPPHLPASDPTDVIATLDAAERIALNVVEQATKAGVKHVVFTSSYAAMFHPTSLASPLADTTVTENDWCNITREDVKESNGNQFFLYFGCKTVAERALWRFADEHPEVEVATILPPYFYGPLAPGVTIKKGDQAALSTNGFVYALIAGPGGGPVPPLMNSFYVDVRDTAQAHVLALQAPPTSFVGRKRIIVSGGYFTWHEAVEHLIKARPELKHRLPDPTKGPVPVKTQASLDTSKAKELLGLEKFIGWEKTIEDSVDDLLRLEAVWKAQD